MPEQQPDIFSADSCADGYCTDTARLYPVLPWLGNTPASTEQIFGANSSLNPVLHSVSEAPVSRTQGEYNVIIFNSLLLSVFLIYVLIVYRLRDYVIFLFKILTNKSHLESTVSSHNMLFRNFIVFANIMGIISLTALLMKIYMVSDYAGGEFDAYVFPAIAAAILLVFLYRYLIHAVIAKIIARKDFIRELKFFDRIVFSLASLVISLFVLFAGYLGDSNKILLYHISFILLVIFLLYYLMKSCEFFVARKVSILEWILYLCGVEILPVSFFLFLAMRDFRL